MGLLGRSPSTVDCPEGVLVSIYEIVFLYGRPLGRKSKERFAKHARFDIKALANDADWVMFPVSFKTPRAQPEPFFDRVSSALASFVCHCTSLLDGSDIRAFFNLL